MTNYGSRNFFFAKPCAGSVHVIDARKRPDPDTIHLQAIDFGTLNFDGHPHHDDARAQRLGILQNPKRTDLKEIGSGLRCRS